MSGALAAMVSGAAGFINSALPNGSSSVGSGGWELMNDGTYSVSNGAGVAAGNWVTPATSGIAALYEVKVDVTSGAFTSGTTGSFLALSLNRSWTKEVAGAVEFTVTIREAATGIVRSVQAGKTLTVS